MSDTTSRLGLPFILPAQAQKHVTHNEALQRLDAVVHLAIEGEQNAVPALPPDGACYLVGASPAGEWSGHAADVAIYQDGYWQFVSPAPGWTAWFVDDGNFLVFDGNGWRTPAQGSTITAEMVGINATADGTNRLSVSAPATLLNHAGGGHQLKINKATGADTATLLFQTGWSGRAEMGLTGSDAFAIKVSGDGSGWAEALRIDASGAVSFPHKPVVRTSSASGTVAIPDGTVLGFASLHVNQGGFTLGAAAIGGGAALVVPVSGYYAITLNVVASAGSAHAMSVEKNATETILTVSGGSTAGSAATASAMVTSYLTAGDTLLLRTSGAATYSLGYGATELTAFLL